jgi:hypothetical protein
MVGSRPLLPPARGIGSSILPLTTTSNQPKRPADHSNRGV